MYLFAEFLGGAFEGIQGSSHCVIMCMKTFSEVFTW